MRAASAARALQLHLIGFDNEGIGASDQFELIEFSFQGQRLKLRHLPFFACPSNAAPI